MPSSNQKVIPLVDKSSTFSTEVNSSPTNLNVFALHDHDPAILNAFALHDLGKQDLIFFQLLKSLYERQKYIQYYYNDIRKSIEEIEKGFAQVSASEEAIFLDWQEKYIDKIDRDIGEMKESLRETEERIANMIDRSLAEIRDRDNQRHQEMLTLISEINAIKNDNLETRRWIIGMVISAIGVSLAAIIGMLSIAF